MTERAIAIVGAGLAGLYAARLLNAEGVDFVLIEARDRLGGRIVLSQARALAVAGEARMNAYKTWQRKVNELCG